MTDRRYAWELTNQIFTEVYAKEGFTKIKRSEVNFIPRKVAPSFNYTVCKTISSSIALGGINKQFIRMATS